MDHENKDYIEKFARINKIFEDLDDIDITLDELSTINNSTLRIKIFDIKDAINDLKQELEK